MSRPRRWRTPVLVFAAALALFTLTAGGSLTSSDSVTTFALTASLVDRQSIALAAAGGGVDPSPGADGRLYSRYGIGQAIYNIPFYLAGKAVVRGMGRAIGRPDSIPKAVVALGSAVAAAACVLVVWLLSRRVGATPHSALVAAASAAVASPLWPYSKFGFSTALTALVLLAGAWFLADREPRHHLSSAAAAGAVLACGWLTRHEMAIALVPFVAYLVLTDAPSRWRRAAVFVGCACAGGLLWGWYNVVRFGSPLSVGYSPEFNGSGYAAFLLSPAGSILLFAPIVIVWLTGLFAPGAAGRADRVLLAGPLVVFYLFYGALTDWPGGRSYGPRYLVPALLLLAPGAAWLWERGRRWHPAIAAAIVVAALLQLPGVLVDYSKISVDWARGAAADEIAHRNWTIAASPFVLNARAAGPAVSRNLAYLTGREPLPRVATSSGADDRDFAQQFAFSLDFWWVYLVHLRALSIRAALAIAAGLAVTAAVCSAMAWRSAGQMPA
jgi:Dolichyl-phosphate-mannose-protein mannosyltransferase